MNDNASESERWVPGTVNETFTPDPDLWLPVPSRAQHDEPITFEIWERRERARSEAEAVIANAFEQKP